MILLYPLEVDTYISKQFNISREMTTGKRTYLHNCSIFTTSPVVTCSLKPQNSPKGYRHCISKFTIYSNPESKWKERVTKLLQTTRDVTLLLPLPFHHQTWMKQLSLIRAIGLQSLAWFKITTLRENKKKNTTKHQTVWNKAARADQNVFWKKLNTNLSYSLKLEKIHYTCLAPQAQKKTKRTKICRQHLWIQCH